MLMARNVFSSCKKCSGQGSVRFKTGFSTTGASEAERVASDGAIEGCLPTRASRVGAEEEATLAVTDRAFRPLGCLFAVRGGVTGIAGTSVAALDGEEGGHVDAAASAAAVLVAALVCLSFGGSAAVAAEGGGDTI